MEVDEMQITERPQLPTVTLLDVYMKAMADAMEVSVEDAKKILDV